MYQCKQCLATAKLPPGADPHASTWCGCCPVDHHHGRQAASCPGNGGVGHPGEPCNQPNPRNCPVILGQRTPPGEPGPDPDDECPGGHCGVGVAGCTVCRPITHFAEVGNPLSAEGRPA